MYNTYTNENDILMKICAHEYKYILNLTHPNIYATPKYLP